MYQSSSKQPSLIIYLIANSKTVLISAVLTILISSSKYFFCILTPLLHMDNIFFINFFKRVSKMYVYSGRFSAN